jgi:hypothetical protein
MSYPFETALRGRRGLGNDDAAPHLTGAQRSSLGERQLPQMTELFGLLLTGELERTFRCLY